MSLLFFFVTIFLSDTMGNDSLELIHTTFSQIIMWFFFANWNSVEFLAIKEKGKQCKCEILVIERKVLNIE